MLYSEVPRSFQTCLGFVIAKEDAKWHRNFKVILTIECGLMSQSANNPDNKAQVSQHKEDALAAATACKVLLGKTLRWKTGRGGSRGLSLEIKV